ncbi:MAG: ATP synthase F0 subunit B [Bdellovibrionota bacterium]
MDAIIAQLGLDWTFFVQFGIFVILFGVMGPVFFKPFLKLIEARHQRTVADREAADKMMAIAEAKMREYQTQITSGKLEARKSFEESITAAKKEEAEILAQARTEAKKIVQDATIELEKQKVQIQKALEVEVVSIAKSLADRLLAGKI